MISKYKISIILVIPALLFIFSCSGGEMSHEKVTYGSLKDVPESKWQKLAQKKVFFGHQSIGDNIIAGIEDIMKTNPSIKMNIIQLKESPRTNSGSLIHDGDIGENGLPEKKIEHFTTVLNDRLPNEVDIAFMKFCFLDINAKTDLDKVLTTYSDNIRMLQVENPKTKFVHFTIPLLRKQKKNGIKSWINKMLGKKDDGFFANEHNIARNKYNQRLINQYNDKEAIFDIAGIESTFADGTRCSFKNDDNIYYSLVPDYTHDGGHLNENGRSIVAEQLLLLLVNMD